MGFQRRTHIIEGPLALRTQRMLAARQGALGRDALSLTQLAARLAGGFKAAAGADELFPAIRASLLEGGFQELDAVRDLPGTARAVAVSLDKIWRTGVLLQELSGRHNRLADLALVEQRVQQRLPQGRLCLPELQAAAIARLPFAPAVFGTILIDGCLDVDPLWRPLLNGLTQVTEVSWRCVDNGTDRSWFKGRLLSDAPQALPELVAESSADPRAEVVEALRWARARLSEGTLQAEHLGLAAVSTEVFDEHMLVLSRTAQLRVHFSHGRPALTFPDGQACAALADILLNGLDQPRVRRLIRRLPESGLLKRLPEGWTTSVPQGAGLFTVAHWQAVIAASSFEKAGELAELLLPVLDLLARGSEAAHDAGEMLLVGLSRELWRQALRLAPAEALMTSLQGLRVPDTTDPNNSIVWGPAAHLANAPRPAVRLLGLTSGAWPRIESEDAILPEHVLERRLIEPVSVTERDRRAFIAIRHYAVEDLVLSRARRSANGSVQSPSPLWPAAGERTFAKTRTPEHAFSEADRLLARPTDAQREAQIQTSRACWRDWHDQRETSHDGVLDSKSPVLGAALSRIQSTTSLARLLCDPLGFVWRYGLGWFPLRFDSEPLSLSPAEYGELEHEIVGRSVAALSGGPGVERASATERLRAISDSCRSVEGAWPLHRPVPPLLLWRATVAQAGRDTDGMLAVVDSGHANSKSWAEVQFGDEATAASADAPWDTQRLVRVGETSVSLKGRIDRIDLTPAGQTARITDYKTGQPPARQRFVLAGGRELQRVVYAMATKQLLPGLDFVQSRLVYCGDPSRDATLTGEELERAEAKLVRYVTAAQAMLQSGVAVPGSEVREKHYELRLALPADFSVYVQKKQGVFAQRNRSISDLWSEP